MSLMFPTPLGSIGPASSGQTFGLPYGALGIQRLPTDPIGSAIVTFRGVHAGSEIRVYDAAGVELAGIESCDNDQVLIWPAFAYGSPNNTVTIRIVANAYELIELEYVTGEGAQAITVQQAVDKWYRNP